MVRLIVYLLLLALGTAGLAWVADRPGTLTIDWMGYQSRVSVFQAVVLILVFLAALWLALTLLRSLLQSPRSVSQFLSRRKQQQGLEALTSGMIAVGAGDRQLAARYATQASRALPNEPLTDVLRAQTALLSGDRKTAQRVYESMLLTPQTELLGLRGLYLEAEKSNDLAAARNLAEQALKRGPKLAWASDALFEIQCRQADWAGAIETLVTARRNDHVTRKESERRRAVLLTAQAMDLEDKNAPKAEALALEAHDLAPDLVPAAEIAGRLLASRGRMQKASAVVEQTWRRAPHPDLALVHAHARPGDSPRDRLQRVRKLAALTPGNREGILAVVGSAIDARAWEDARTALEPLLADRLSARVCVLMARVEGGEKGDSGRVREWLARAIHAPRDPVWVADTHVSDRWAPVSPVTGRLDAYEWKVAEERTEKVSGALLLEELAQYAAPERDALTDSRTSRSSAATVEPDMASDSSDRERPVSVKAAVAPPANEPVSLAAKRGLRAVDMSKSDTDTAAKDTVTTLVLSADRTASATQATQSRRGQAVTAETAPNAPARSEADVEFFVAPRPPDDPGTEAKEPVRQVAS